MRTNLLNITITAIAAIFGSAAAIVLRTLSLRPCYRPVPVRVPGGHKRGSSRSWCEDHQPMSSPGHQRQWS